MKTENIQARWKNTDRSERVQAFKMQGYLILRLMRCPRWACCREESSQLQLYHTQIDVLEAPAQFRCKLTFIRCCISASTYSKCFTFTFFTTICESIDERTDYLASCHRANNWWYENSNPKSNTRACTLNWHSISASPNEQEADE